MVAFPPNIQELFDVGYPILYGKDVLLIAGIMLMAVGFINIARSRRRRKRMLEALASGKHWY